MGSARAHRRGGVPILLSGVTIIARPAGPKQSRAPPFIPPPLPHPNPPPLAGEGREGGLAGEGRVGADCFATLAMTGVRKRYFHFPNPSSSHRASTAAS